MLLSKIFTYVSDIKLANMNILILGLIERIEWKGLVV